MDNLEGMSLLPEKCANLIIADPPYFEIKGEFDFVFKDFAEYLEFMEQQAKAYKRILADNGTLFVYGYAKRIAYVQVIFDKYFNLENSLVWRKPYSFTEMFSDDLRSFPMRCFERILMYSNDFEPNGYSITGLESVHNNPENFKTIKQYLDDELCKSGIVLKDVNSIWGNLRASHCFGFTKKNKSQFQFLSEAQYALLQTKTGNFGREYEALRQEYEAQRQEYEAQRRPFNNYLKLHDCFEFTNGNPSNYDHDTVKPETLTRALLLTCSRPNDLVVVPFSGSGTEHAMAIKEGRRSIGFDIEKKYVDMSNKRAAVHLSAPPLFNCG